MTFYVEIELDGNEQDAFQNGERARAALKHTLTALPRHIGPQYMGIRVAVREADGKQIGAWGIRQDAPKTDNAPPLAPAQCQHGSIAWEALEMDYGPDGLAEVSQAGTCNDCGVKLVVGYNLSAALFKRA